MELVKFIIGDGDNLQREPPLTFTFARKTGTHPTIRPAGPDPNLVPSKTHKVPLDRQKIL